MSQDLAAPREAKIRPGQTTPRIQPVTFRGQQYTISLTARLQHFSAYQSTRGASGRFWPLIFRSDVCHPDVPHAGSETGPQVLLLDSYRRVGAHLF